MGKITWKTIVWKNGNKNKLNTDVVFMEKNSRWCLKCNLGYKSFKAHRMSMFEIVKHANRKINGGLKGHNL